MDQIDINLIEAWNRIGEQCRRDRAEALVRSRRRLLGSMRRPPRAWMLCIRAADSRIDLDSGIFEFDDEADARDGLERGVPHAVELDGRVIRELTKPVCIDWPGVPIRKVAAMIGRNYHTVYNWLDRSEARMYTLDSPERSLANRKLPRSAQSIQHVGALKVSGYSYPGIHRKRGRGMPMAMVYTPSPIDPNHEAGLPPDRVWGSVWQYLHEKLPENFLQRFERVPRHTKSGRFRGWHWVCPGLLDSEGKHRGCGKLVRAVYAPMPIWTLPQSGAQRFALEMPKDSGLVGTWHPGEHEQKVGEGRRAFACRYCWNISYPRMSDGTGWNEFVSYISGGLLRGSEVERPLDEAPLRRRNRPEQPRRRKAARCEEAVTHLLSGLSARQIGKRMGLTKAGAQSHIRRAMQREGVSSTKELIEKLKQRESPQAVVSSVSSRAVTSP